MRSDAMTIRAATSADTDAVRRMAAALGVVGDLRRRRYELLRLNGGTAEARVLMRRLTATALAA
jgi:hypothetical protein